MLMGCVWTKLRVEGLMNLKQSPGLMRAVEWTWAQMGAVDIGVGGDGLWAWWE